VLQTQAGKLHKGRRQILLGYGNFRNRHAKAQAVVTAPHIAHACRHGPPRKHDWHSGRAAEAVARLPPIGNPAQGNEGRARSGNHSRCRPAGTLAGQVTPRPRTVDQILFTGNNWPTTSRCRAAPGGILEQLGVKDPALSTSKGVGIVFSEKNLPPVPMALSLCPTSGHRARIHVTPLLRLPFRKCDTAGLSVLSSLRTPAAPLATRRRQLPQTFALQQPFAAPRIVCAGPHRAKPPSPSRSRRANACYGHPCAAKAPAATRPAIQVPAARLALPVHVNWAVGSRQGGSVVGAAEQPAVGRNALLEG
jgi:hypothetical protein